MGPPKPAATKPEYLQKLNLDPFILVLNKSFDKFTKSSDQANSTADYGWDDPKKTIKLQTGKFRNAAVPKRLIDDAIAAAEKAGVDPHLMLGLIGQESTFGVGKNQGSRERRVSKQALVSGHNLAEKFQPQTPLNFLADRKVPGVQSKRTFHGWRFSIPSSEDSLKVQEYLYRNPKLLEQYEKKVNSQNVIPKDVNYFDLAAWAIKQNGIQKYNPGDPTYTDSVENSMNLLRQDPVLAEYLKSRPAKKEDGGIIEDQRGQWANPGKPTRIQGEDITMKGVDYPVLAKTDNGLTTVMKPNQEYKFPGAKHVDEFPIKRRGGTIGPRFSMGSAGGAGKDPTFFFKWSFGNTSKTKQTSKNSIANLGNYNTQLLFNKLSQFKQGGSMTLGDTSNNKRSILKQGVGMAKLYPLPFKKGGKMPKKFLGGLFGPKQPGFVGTDVDVEAGFQRPGVSPMRMQTGGKVVPQPSAFELLAKKAGNAISSAFAGSEMAKGVQANQALKLAQDRELDSLRASNLALRTGTGMQPINGMPLVTKGGINAVRKPK